MKALLISRSRQVADVLMLPFTLLCSFWMMFVVRKSFATMPLTKSTFLRFGFLPIRDHFYQPLINPTRHLTKPLRAERTLPGIDLNEADQLDLLRQFRYADELRQFPMEKPGKLAYYYNNGSFASGDSEYLYNMIRHTRPRRLVEIGSGNSTLMAINAIAQNRDDDSTYVCDHVCIEPYKMPWLEQTSVTVHRTKVEDVDRAVFKSLQAGDMLFIDSSHIIRPQGDVLTEYLEILPILNKGVRVHIHDIFTPCDYLHEWIFKEHFLWNEQYLLEAFLSFNQSFRIIGAVNYLKHHHFDLLATKCPILATQPHREPGSFWIEKL